MTQDRDQLKEIIQSVLAESRPSQPKTDDAHVPWWIKVFGSTVVVIVASLVVGFGQNVYSNIRELECETKRQAEKLIGKEEFNATKASQWNAIKSLQEKANQAAAAEERLKLVEERVRKLEADNGKLHPMRALPLPLEYQR